MISYQDYARQILEGQTLQDKLLSATPIWDEWKEFDLPQLPGRIDAIQFSKEKLKFPKGHLDQTEKKAIAIHSFANHELLAIEMMACAILIYPHDTGEESLRFKKGIVSALKDEQKHLSLYIGRINQLGYEFGDFPLNDYFWRQMSKLKTPAQYVSVMSLTFEAANLDFAQYYSKLFKSYGDHITAQILDTVLEDEISHVAFGGHWLKRWRQDLDLWKYYLECLPAPMTPARGRGIGYDPALHMEAMNDSEFVSSLTKYEDDFSITKRGGR